MKTFIVACLALVSFACAEEGSFPGYSTYGYLVEYGIPQAEKIRVAEEKYLASQAGSRIVGGVPAGQGQYPYQAGLLISIIGFEGSGVCGGSLISANRVATAAHCWFDGIHQGWRITVVLGSSLLFSGGSLLDTSVVAMHPNWTPALVRNDVAVIYLPNAVQLSANIAPIALASGSSEFVGASAIASGFGLTSSGGYISANQFLSHVSLNVMANSACSIAFPFIVQPSNICTSGIGGVGTCNGDSGGPLVTNQNGQNVLIGITSFGSAFGCQVNLPSVFARVTSFVSFLQQHIN
uniref:Chymotrypsin-like protease C8 n=1 Tax=Heliothis virescens TaxID=7102 RepID=B4X991_HELVI|nr:chymotrypsin-like protease C8 [Heliothis virescens]